MNVNPALVERIYEAAALPERWPEVLQEVASGIDAFGVCFVHRAPDHAGWVVSERMDAFAEAYIAEGWLQRDGRVPPVIVEQYPGFRVDADYWTEQQVQELPIYRDFLLPRGLKASGACALQGARDDALHIGVEGLASYAGARSAVPLLDAMRPHLARAISLAVKLSRAQIDASVAALELAGVGAAVVSPDGRRRAANDRFRRRLGDRITERAGKLRFTDRSLDAQFATGLAATNADADVRSIGVAASPDEPALAVHLIPLRRSARDVFGWDGVLLLVAEAANASVPGADLLRLLFDLTPAEARLARHVVEGRSTAEAARSMAIAETTARVHLRRIFDKTGARRQADLVRLVLGLGAPG